MKNTKKKTVAQEKEPLEQKNGTEQTKQTPETLETPEMETTAATGAAQAAEPLVLEDAVEQETYTLTAEEFAAAKAHIESLQKEKDDTVLLLQRIQADFDNFRRRNASVRLDSYEEGKRDALKSMLPALDSFDRALASAGEADAGFAEGVKLVQRQLLDAMTKLGLEEVDASGAFDPNLHEAVMREKADDKTSGQVLEVLQKGYRVGDKIIRHAMVKVAE